MGQGGLRDDVPFSWSFVCDTRRMDEQSQVDGQGDTAGFSPCFPVTDMRAALAPPTVTHDGAAHKS
jgi:hypothetical protein